MNLSFNINQNCSEKGVSTYSGFGLLLKVLPLFVEWFEFLLVIEGVRVIRGET